MNIIKTIAKDARMILHKYRPDLCMVLGLGEMYIITTIGYKIPAPWNIAWYIMGSLFALQTIFSFLEITERDYGRSKDGQEE